MDSINLASYVIRFKKKQNSVIGSSDYLEWDDLLNFGPQKKLIEKKVSVFDLLSNLEKDKLYSNENIHKSIRLDSYDFGSNMYYGRVYYGKFGEKGKIVHVKKDSIDDKDISGDMSVMKLFYFLFYFDAQDKEKGVLILERKGNRGIKSIFTEWLKKEVFSDCNKYFNVEINDFIPRNLLNSYIKEGNIASFEFSEIRSHKDSSNILNKDLNNIVGKIKVELKIDEGYMENAKQWLKRFINGDISSNSDDEDFIILSEINKDNFKTTIVLNEKPRVFSFGGANVFKPYLDITEDINNFNDGIPRFDEIHKLAVNHAKYLLNSEDDENG